MSVYPDFAWLGARLGPDDGPLYALIDCARDSRLHGWLRAPGVYSQSLHSGVQALRLERYGPFCTLIEPGRGLAEPWFSDRGLGWREHWGWLFQSRAPLSSIVLHFKKFLRVDSAGGPLYWRFYDPRALPEPAPAQPATAGGVLRRLHPAPVLLRRTAPEPDRTLAANAPAGERAHRHEATACARTFRRPAVECRSAKHYAKTARMRLAQKQLEAIRQQHCVEDHERLKRSIREGWIDARARLQPLLILADDALLDS